MQTREWAETFHDERETAEDVLTLRAGKIIACSTLRRVRHPLAGEKCFVDGGPVFESDADFAEHLRDLLSATSDCVYLRLRPYLSAGEGARVREVLRDHGFEFPAGQEQSGYVNTLLLDLTRPMSDLENDFSSHLRRNLRRASRTELSVGRAVDAATAREFAHLLARVAKTAGYDVPPAERVAAFIANFCMADSRDGALFCASESGRIRAGIVVLRAGHSLVYHWGAREDSVEDHAPLAHALHLQAMAWGQELGYQQYDFGGLFSAEGASGIDRFKRSFGGRVEAWFGEAIRRRGLRGWLAGRRRAPAIQGA